MARIYKYQVHPADSIQTLKLPKDSLILTAVNQGDVVTLYAVVHQDETEMVDYQFAVVGTGWNVDYLDGFTYLDTVTTLNGDFVWHVFKKED